MVGTVKKRSLMESMRLLPPGMAFELVVQRMRAGGHTNSVAVMLSKWRQLERSRPKLHIHAKRLRKTPSKPTERTRLMRKIVGLAVQHNHRIVLSEVAHLVYVLLGMTDIDRNLLDSAVNYYRRRLGIRIGNGGSSAAVKI